MSSTFQNKLTAPEKQCQSEEDAGGGGGGWVEPAGGGGALEAPCGGGGAGVTPWEPDLKGYTGGRPQNTACPARHVIISLDGQVHIPTVAPPGIPLVPNDPVFLPVDDVIANHQDSVINL